MTTSTADRPHRRLARTLALCLALLAGACAPTLQPMGPRTGPPAITQDAFRAADGTMLPLKRWLPDGRPTAVILALHGFNDYSNAFDAAGRYWAARGVATYAYDQRGFGRTDRRGIWPGTETMVADLLDATAALSALHPDTPLYLLGESMGGAVLMAALAGRDLPPGVAGAILSAPAVWSRDTMPFYQRWALFAATWTVPWMELKPPRNLNIRPSDNIEMLRALGRDPLVIKATRVDAVRGLTNLMDLAMESADDFAVPSLILYGANEQVIPKVPREKAMARFPDPPAPDAGPRLALYDDGWHMLLRDLQAEVVWRDVLAWIGDRAAPLPSGADGHAAVAELRNGGGPE